ncbi:MAG: DUF420 domain-containing protein [Planctomycetales bacterium]|nr:DUF420 domain-containing protein [Planctomycetales bacterium]
MLDVVFLAMFAVIPVMGWSIYLVKYRQRYQLHKRIQLTLAAILLAAVTLFEIDIRLYGWEHLAAPDGEVANRVYVALYVHLVFAITTLVFWIVAIGHAWRSFPAVPAPNEHSPRHRLLGKLAAIDMTLTALTGWIFYVLAFVVGP